MIGVEGEELLEDETGTSASTPNTTLTGEF
jgi:hypothetical protein